MLEAVLFLLSVSVSTMTAILSGPNPSYLKFSKFDPVVAEDLSIALSILSFGILADLAAWIADLNLGLIAGSLSPSLAATVISFESLRYEGFGPDKVAVIVETLTDNKNRTASNIRTIFQKAGGSLGTQGSASHNFNQMGVIKINKDEISDEEILELAIESGADECVSKDEFHEIQCSVNEIYNVKKNLEKKINNFISTEIEWISLNSVQVSKEQEENLIEFFETLEDNDDVQNIFSNVELNTN